MFQRHGFILLFARKATASARAKEPDASRMIVDSRPIK
jgi:hypothetical protein